jgi:hypothetical protein
VIKEHVHDVYIYKHIDNEEYETDHFIHIHDPLNIFIGKSADPDNYEEFGSTNYDSYFDGNSILIEIANKEYMFVGLQIFTFTAYYNIIAYHSPVGPNNVVYPHAIDINGNYYLLIENLVAHFAQPIKDPYMKYYNEYCITQDPNKEPLKYPDFCDIVEYYCKVGHNYYQYVLHYHPNPSKHYDWLEHRDEHMYVVRALNSEIINDEIINDVSVKEFLSKQDYVCLMKKFGKLMGYKRLKNKKILQNRYF